MPSWPRWRMQESLKHWQNNAKSVFARRSNRGGCGLSPGLPPRLALRQAAHIRNQAVNIRVLGASRVFRRHLVSFTLTNDVEEFLVGLAGEGFGIRVIQQGQVHAGSQLGFAVARVAV